MSIDKSSKKTYNISNKGKSPTTKSTHKYAYNNTCIKTLIPINGDAGAKTDIKSK
jgi:hypothetical protein